MLMVRARSFVRAQEEYLARSSGLYACIRDNAMYAFHRGPSLCSGPGLTLATWLNASSPGTIFCECPRRDPLYTNYAIYSPDVPVFRSDDGSLLDEPYTVGIITCPAVNAGKMAPERRSEIGPAMWLRILKVLSIGVKHSHDSIVLGAWGCGAFGNDGHEIAEMFYRALEQNFKGDYRQVVFAIVDWSRDRRFIGPFQEAFRVN